MYLQTKSGQSGLQNIKDSFFSFYLRVAKVGVKKPEVHTLKIKTSGVKP